MEEFLIDLLACPACHGGLVWDVEEKKTGRIETGVATCRMCGATYPVREGIGVFLTPDLPREDLWDQADTGLSESLREQPDAERKLIESPVEALNPADQFLRSWVLEERGDLAGARMAAEVAHRGLYTSEYLAAWESQYEFLLDRLADGEGPVIDLASGLGYLVERMATRLTRPIVATDFSPMVLRRDRRRLDFLGLGGQVSLLAFDARRTPFRGGAVGTLTTNVGLANIRESATLLSELRRAVSGTFHALSIFYPEGDEANGALLREYGLDGLMYRGPLMDAFTAAGWSVEVRNSRQARALPTPQSELLGFGIDGLPVAETTLEWCVLEAH